MGEYEKIVSTTNANTNTNTKNIICLGGGGGGESHIGMLYSHNISALKGIIF